MKIKKTSYFITLMTLFMAVMLGMSLVSCNKDNGNDPDVEPKKELENEEKKEMESAENTPTKVVITVHDGHLHGVYGFHQNTHSKGVKYLAVNKEFIYWKKDGKWVADDKNPSSLNVQSPSACYAFIIDYYNFKNEKINGQFIDNGANKRHQHFFMPENIKAGYGKYKGYKFDGDMEDFFSYTYCDTDPWDKTYKFHGATFVGKDDPQGFKGYLKFGEGRVTFDLVIKLIKAKNSKRIDGELSPYYQPADGLLKEAKTIAEIKLPINVFMEMKDLLNGFIPDPSKTEKDYSSEDQMIINSLAKAFNITFKEAVNEFYLNQNGQRDSEGGQFWF